MVFGKHCYMIKTYYVQKLKRSLIEFDTFERIGFFCVCVCHARMREYAGLKKPSLLGVIFQLQNHFNNFGKNTYITACSMNNTI